jgi:hypothetical protein
LSEVGCRIQYNADLAAGEENKKIKTYPLVPDPYSNIDTASQFYHLSFTSILGIVWEIAYDTAAKYTILDERTG